jgi:uncharacterized protein YndB with AHSA1/START domain
VPAHKKPNELYLERVYDAPLAAVWDAWNDPEQAAQWWGPRGFTITTHSKDLRVGGTWRYTMHGPDGTDYPNVTPYLEVEPLKKLVYDHGGSDDQPPLFRVTALFSAVNSNKTKLQMTMSFAMPEVATDIRKFIRQVGGNSTWDRLAEYLCKESKGEEIFVINRTFAAPLEKVFDAWSMPESVAAWSPPTGFIMEFMRCEIRPGGTSFYSMSGQGGMKMYGRCEYLEIERPKRIVYTQQFCDEHEKVGRHPMASTWPETMLTSVVFTAEDDIYTRVTITWQPFGTVTPDELATFIAARGGMTQGWTGSLDKLEEFLSS